MSVWARGGNYQQCARASLISGTNNILSLFCEMMRGLKIKHFYHYQQLKLKIFVPHVP
jgi:hypothetical protein